MTENRGLLSGGWAMVTHNKRYIFWFWLLNMTLAEFGTAAFRNQAHAVLDQSLYSDKLVHGFNLSVLIEMVARPEFGPTKAPTMAAVYFITLFFITTALFFRACGRNLWRFIRLLIVAGIVLGIVCGILFGIEGALVKKAGDSTNELLSFEVHMITLAIIFLAMTVTRIWFDLAEVDLVLSDQNAVRRSIATGFRSAFSALGRLLASYVLITVVAAVVLIGGLWAWMHMVPASSVWGAFWVGQLTLLLLLIPRFWQRGVAVAYYQQRMLVPAVRPEPIIPEPVPAAVVLSPSPIPNIPAAPQES
jgi:hypothetical protein